MSTLATPSTRRLLCAYRGASENPPEDVIAALQGAIAAGADVFGVGVGLDSEDELVAEYASESPGAPAAVALDQLLALARGQIALNLELAGSGPVERLTAAVSDWTGGLLTTAVDPQALLAVRRRDPRRRTGLIVAAPVTVHPVRVARHCGAGVVLWEDELATPTALRACAEAELHAWVWTINAPFRLAERFADPAIDGVVTDIPALAVSLQPSERQGPRA